MTPEAKVKAQIRAYLKEIGAFYVQPIGSGFGSASLDFFVCWRGRFIAIEAKREGGVPTPRQKALLQDVLHAGGSAWVISGPAALAVLKLLFEGMCR